MINVLRMFTLALILLPAQKPSPRKEKKVLARGQVLAQVNYMTGYLKGSFGDRYQVFVFGLQPTSQKDAVSLIKVMYKFFYTTDKPLPDSFFDAAQRYQLQLVRWPDCDETMQNLSYEKNVDAATGKPLASTYILQPLNGVSKEIFQQDLLLPCYGLEPGKYKVLNGGATRPVLVTQATRADSLTPHPSAVADEEPLPQDPRERAARLAKFLRYSGGKGDLTKSDELFFEQYEPRSLPLIPLGESAIAFKGQVIKMQAFLSADRSHIYTEITLRVDEIFKQVKDFKLSSGQTLMVTQIGGALKLRSGRVIRDETREGFMGKPYLGGRYVLFADRVNKGEDLTMIKAYELRDGKVFKLTEDGSVGTTVLSRKRNKRDSLSSEKTFLQTLRSTRNTAYHLQFYLDT